MDKKKKEKKYIFGIIGGFILGLVFSILTTAAYIYTDFIGILGAILFIGIFEYFGYKIFQGKIDKKTPWIIMGLSIVNVLIMSFMIIPVALLVKSNIQFSFKEAVNLYKNSNISLNIVQDCLLSLVLSLLGSYAIGTVINKKVMLNVNKVKLFSSDNKEKQEYKEVAINATKSIFEKLEATDEAKAVKKEDLIEQINNKNAKEYINYLYSLRIIKKYKGKLQDMSFSTNLLISSDMSKKDVEEFIKELSYVNHLYFLEKDIERIGINTSEVYNYFVEIIYSKYKQGYNILWDIFSGDILQQLNNGKMVIPIEDKEGDTEYFGKRYSLMEVSLDDNI